MDIVERSNVYHSRRVIVVIKDRVAKKWITLVAAFLFTAISSLFAVSSPAHAISIYDDSYHSTPDLVLQHVGSCPNMPPTGNYTNYAKYILDENLWHPDDRNSSSFMYSARESYLAAINDNEYGTWGVSKETNYGGVGIEAISIYWSKNPNAHLLWSDLSVDAYSFSQLLVYCNGYSWGYKYSNYFGGKMAFGPGIVPVSTKPSIPRPSRNLFFHSNNPNFNYNYPSSYEGELIVGNTDEDNDGLARSLELTQGTNDNSADSDNDGLSDFTESQWNPERNNLFCGSECAYPNPIKKDVYVEVDWMKDASNRNLKPSVAQIALVKNAFTNKGINLYVDTGQYGGGNELSEYIPILSFQPQSSLVPDFFDFKNGDMPTITPHFSQGRHSIWRYMITGNRYNDGGNNNSTGIARVSDDDIFLSLGLMMDSNLSDKDTAIAGTFMHELGHSLCLSGSSLYSTQPLQCVHSAIDDDDPTNDNYKSSMNYTYQQSLVNYSDGSHGLGDHDDWSAVLAGMGDFVGRSNLSEAQGARLSSEIKAIPNISIEEAERLEKKQLMPGGARPIEFSAAPFTMSDSGKSTIASESDYTTTMQRIKNYEDESDLVKWLLFGTVPLLVIIGVIYYRISR